MKQSYFAIYLQNTLGLNGPWPIKPVWYLIPDQNTKQKRLHYIIVPTLQWFKI